MLGNGVKDCKPSGGLTAMSTPTIDVVLTELHLRNAAVMVAWLWSAARAGHCVGAITSPIRVVRQRSSMHMTSHSGATVRSSAAAVSVLPSRLTTPPPPVIRVLPGVPESAAAARRLARQVLGDRHPAADTAMLLVSELVTNSVLHSQSRRPGGSVTVAICAGPTSVLIQVRDDGGPCRPRLLTGPSPEAAADGAAAAAARAEHGYGLLLVDALAATWGTVTTTDGRVTWCRLAVGQACDGGRDSAGEGAADHHHEHHQGR
jgi:anti-sigma regulatory factor (Ser/Thr protein kinase)